MERMTNLYVLDPVGLVNFGEELRVGDGDHLVEPEHKFKKNFSHHHYFGTGTLKEFTQFRFAGYSAGLISGYLTLSGRQKKILKFLPKFHQFLIDVHGIQIRWNFFKIFFRF